MNTRNASSKIKAMREREMNHLQKIHEKIGKTMSKKRASSGTKKRRNQATKNPQGEGQRRNVKWAFSEILPCALRS